MSSPAETLPPDDFDRVPWFLRGIARRWCNFWFKPAAAVDFGLCRFLFFVGVLWSRIPGDAGAWGKIPSRFYRPIGLFDDLKLPIFRSNTLQNLEYCWWVLLLMAAVGSFTRTTVALSFIIGLYTLGLPNNFGKMGHGDQLTILIMLIFALSSCGDGFSIDRWFKTKRGQPPAELSPEYRWPIRMVWVLMASVFCAAGVTKLHRVGLAWITSDNFEIMMIQAHYGLNRPPTNWGLHLAHYPRLCNFLAGGAVALELLFPLSLFHRRLRMVLVPMTLSMQIGIGLVMGIWFMPFLRAYLFWVPWDRIRQRVRRGVATAKGRA